MADIAGGILGLFLLVYLNNNLRHSCLLMAVEKNILNNIDFEEIIKIFRHE